MANDTKIFHESWYRIANEKLCLRSSVKVHRQLFRGARWYVLSDPFNNQFYRLRPEAYEFVIRLGLDRTVEEVWMEMISAAPESAPGQEEVINLLVQLYQSNLLHYEMPPDSAKLFDRYKNKKQRIMKSNLLNIMFFRIPLFDPDSFLKNILPLIRLIMNPLGAILWLTVVGSAIKIVIDRFAEVSVQTQGIINPSNLFLLYIAMLLVKTFHEFGHAFAVRRFGGEVHIIGVMFLLFSPVPYMDATAAWAFRNKWQRILVGAAGMITEIFVAALAVFVWANTSGGLLHSLAYNMMFVASLSTVVFNINPLLRYDGYYMLSDWLDIPNLHTKATQQLTHLVEKYAFGYKRSTSQAYSLKEAFWLAIFGVLSGIYKLIVFASIIFFIADRFLLAGIIMALICCITWIIVPLVKLIKYLSSSPKLERIRLRAITVVSILLLFVVGFFYYFPFPNSFRASGVLKASEYFVVNSKVSGYVKKIEIEPGSQVSAGQPLILLENKEIDLQINEAMASLQESYAMRQLALAERPEDLATVEARIQAIQTRLDRLQHDREELVVKAEISGVWVVGNVADYLGMWIRRGAPIGQIINENAYYFASVIAEVQTSRIFDNEVKRASVKLVGQADTEVPVFRYVKIPMEQTILPSAALGWKAGGDVPIDPNDAQGVHSTEPFYEVRAYLDNNNGMKMFHGRTGKIRFELTSEPLLRQWWRSFRQLVQKRYHY